MNSILLLGAFCLGHEVAGGAAAGVAGWWCLARGRMIFMENRCASRNRGWSCEGEEEWWTRKSV